MDALELLINRRSASRLTEPAPTSEQLQNTLRVGMRAPSHKSMQPWHFFVIEGEKRERFSAVPEQGAIAAGSGNKAIDKVRNVPFRVPLIMAVVIKCRKDREVSRWEQEISAGYAVMVMQMTVAAQGFSGTWRSGALTESPVARETFSYREQDKIIGFLYPDTPQLKASTSISAPDPTSFVICS